jgi:hypothetical protein
VPFWRADPALVAVGAAMTTAGCSTASTPTEQGDVVTEIQKTLANPYGWPCAWTRLATTCIGRRRGRGGSSLPPDRRRDDCQVFLERGLQSLSTVANVRVP